MAISLRTTLALKTRPGNNGEGSTTLTFIPDMDDTRNAEWAPSLPNLNTQFTVTDDVAAELDEGGSYTFTVDATPDA